MIRGAYRFIKKQYHEIVCFPFRDLPEMSTYQEMIQHIEKYSFKWYVGLEKAERFLEATFYELKFMKRAYEEEHITSSLYLLASDDIVLAVLEIINPVMELQINQLNNLPLSKGKCFEIYADYYRIKKLLQSIEHFQMYWSTRDAYLVVLRQLVDIDIALDVYLHHRQLHGCKCL